MIGPVLRAASYGDEKISPSVVAFSEKMMHDTPIATLVGFLHALEVHDETGRGLRALAKMPTLIACGDRRPAHARWSIREAMAAALPKSELVIVGGAGHLVQLEQPETHRRRAGAAGRAGHPVQAGRADAAAAGTGPQPWLTRDARAPPSCPPPRTPSRWARGWARTCAPATSWCCPVRWVRERPCWPRGLRRRWTSTGR